MPAAVNQQVNPSLPASPPNTALLDLLVEQSVSSSKASLLAALATFALFATQDVNAILGFWVLGAVAISGARVVLLSRELRKGHRANDQARSRLHYWTGLASAASWGLFAVVPTANLPTQMHLLVWVVPILVATTAMSSYSIVIRHYRDYLIVLFACLIGGTVFSDGPETLNVVVACVSIAPIIYITGARYHRNLVEAHRARAQAHHMLEKLSEANRHLREQHATITREEEIARHVFHQLTLASPGNPAGIYTWNQAMGSLSGDLIQVAHGPERQTYIFLGDFTGHGLPAALGAVPTSTFFRAMAEKGLPVSEIASELNRKLYHLLPTGYFCCAALIELAAERSALTLWNGGLPPVVIRQGNTGTLTQVRSENLPLGVVGEEAFTDTVSRWPLQSGDTVYIYSDGLTEATNRDGEMWGRRRFIEFLGRNDLHSPRLPLLKEQILNFTKLAPPSDDISVVEIQSLPSQSQQSAA